MGNFLKNAKKVLGSSCWGPYLDLRWFSGTSGTGVVAAMATMALAMAVVAVVASPTKKAAPGNTVPVSSP